MENKQLENILKDVRLAYRLLYQYQKRILDLMSYIGNQLGFSYDQGRPRFAESVLKRGKGILSRWAWDSLSMYFYEFHFGSQEKNEERKVTMSILIQSDTGYFDKKGLTHVERLSVNEFETAKSSKTRLIFVFEANGGWNIDKFFFQKDVSKETNEWDFASEGFYAKAYDLSEFSDNNAINQKLDELNRLINKKLKITLIEKNNS